MAQTLISSTPSGKVVYSDSACWPQHFGHRKLHMRQKLHAIMKPSQLHFNLVKLFVIGVMGLSPEWPVSGVLGRFINTIGGRIRVDS